MDEELKKFRQRKLAEERKEQLKTKVSNVWNAVTGTVAAAVLPDHEDEPEDTDAANNIGSSSVTARDTTKKRQKRKLAAEVGISTDTDQDNKEDGYTKIKIAIMFLKFLCWLFMWLGFIKIGFGAVFFTVSVLYFIWTNTGNTKKRKGHKSAYSVFNENCEAIDGSLKAEQLEKQLLYGGL